MLVACNENPPPTHPDGETATDTRAVGVGKGMCPKNAEVLHGDFTHQGEEISRPGSKRLHRLNAARNFLSTVSSEAHLTLCTMISLDST